MNEMNKQWFGWLLGLEVLAFAVLEGSMITLGLLVAPRLFKTIESRDLAGRTFGNILDSWLWVGGACTLILLGSAFVSWRVINPASRLLQARLAIVVIMTGLIAAFGWVLARLNTIQAGLTKPIEQYPADVNPRLEYDQLHKLSTNLLSPDLFLGLVWLVISVVALYKLAFGRPALAVSTKTEFAKTGEAPNLVSR